MSCCCALSHHLWFNYWLGNRHNTSTVAVICALLLLTSGDIELNPGPSSCSPALNVATLNICSAVSNTGCMHDTVTDLCLTLLSQCEMRLRAIDLDGFALLHVHCKPMAVHPGGGRLAIIYHNSLILHPQTFQYHRMHATSTRPAFMIANVCWLPQASIIQFTDEIADFLSVCSWVYLWPSDNLWWYELSWTRCVRDWSWYLVHSAWHSTLAHSLAVSEE